jgi:menaquinone-dependent protoporphyrinogen oxidase
MSTVQVVYASRHGGTAGIAERIGDELRAAGASVVVADASAQPAPNGFDAYVVGSGVYLGSWLREGVDFLERNAAILAERPVWLFCSGPLPHSSKTVESEDPLTRALGPREGPGSGGRKRIDAIASAIHPREHRVFLGAFDPTDSPKSLQERLVRMLPAAKRVLPAGDFREWDAIEAWARGIAADVSAGREP